MGWHICVKLLWHLYFIVLAKRNHCFLISLNTFYIERKVVMAKPKLFVDPALVDPSCRIFRSCNKWEQFLKKENRLTSVPNVNHSAFEQFEMCNFYYYTGMTK